MKQTIKIKTFGCKVNYYDSLLMKKQLQDIQLSEQQNIFVLNSCAVTAQAGKDVRKEAGKIKRKNPESFVVVTGCGAQVETELYENTESVDLVVGNSDKGSLREILENKSFPKKKVFKSNIFKSPFIYGGFISADEERTRAFLKIQDGCDSFCTFCIIPFARGKSKSFSLSFLVEAVRSLNAKGVQEVVLTGVHIGDYKDGNKGLEVLLSYLLEKTNIPRIRLTSLEPVEITDGLLDCYTDERMCPHFHISLQSASDSVLQSMKRNYRKKEVERSFQKISSKIPQAFVGMDVIAGFPSESQKDFEETYELLKDQPWTSIHVFPYSSRQGAYASRYEPLSQTEVIRRAGLLRHLSDVRFNDHLEKQKGTFKKVLLFKKDNRRGLSRDYWRVQIPSSFRSGEQQVFIEDLDSKKGWLKAKWI